VNKYVPASWGRLEEVGEVAGPHKGQVRSLEGTLMFGSFVGPIGEDLLEKDNNADPEQS
jgi:hypothetical protein